MSLRMRPPSLLLKLLRKRLRMPEPLPVVDVPLATEAIHAALCPGISPGVFTQLLTLGMRLGAPQEVTVNALAHLPDSLTFRDQTELIRQLMLEGMQPHAKRILPSAVECVSYLDAPKDILCILSALTKCNDDDAAVDHFLWLLIERGILVKWDVPALCKMIALSGPRQHIRSVAQMLIVAYLDNTSLDEQDGTLDVLVLRTLADIKAIGVMTLSRVDEVLLRFPKIVNSWSKYTASELMKLASAAHAFATLAPSNLLEWRIPQLADLLSNITISSLSIRPTSRSLAMLLWSISRLAALTASNPVSPERAGLVLSYLLTDSTAPSGDVVLIVWSLARTVGNFSGFIDELQALSVRIDVNDLPKFSWALAIGFGSRDALSRDARMLIQDCVTRYYNQQQRKLQSDVDTGEELGTNPILADSVMLWDSAALAGVPERDMPCEPDVSELITCLSDDPSKRIETALTVCHVGPISTGRLLEALGVHHAPYVPRYITRTDRGLRQPIAKFITCEVELSIGDTDTRVFVVRGGSQMMCSFEDTNDELVDEFSEGHRREPFTGLYLMNDRSTHAEISALNGVANFLSDNSEVGWLHLHVSHFPCLSCIYAIQQFRRSFPNIQVRVSYEWWTSGSEPLIGSAEPRESDLDTSLVHGSFG